MLDSWFYDRERRVDRRGARRHFVHRGIEDDTLQYEERPDERYFRDDGRTVFGVLRFERRKDNPFRNYEVMINKIMNDSGFRKPLNDPGTESVRGKNWK